MKITTRLFVAGCLWMFMGTLYVRPQILGPIFFTNTTVVLPPLSGMQIWWEADVGNNCGGACSDGSSQSTWADQSGNGNNGTLTPAVTIPCVASIYHTNQINGKPAVTFNGNTTAGSETCFSVGNSGAGLNNKSATSMFLVAKYAGTSATGQTFACGGSGAFCWNYQAGANKYQHVDKAAVLSIGSGTAAFDSNWHQLNTTYDGTTLAFRINRASDGSVTNAQTISSNWLVLGINVGGGSFTTLNGQIAEFILYNRVLSGGEITTVETYLNGKYGL